MATDRNPAPCFHPRSPHIHPFRRPAAGGWLALPRPGGGGNGGGDPGGGLDDAWALAETFLAVRGRPEEEGAAAAVADLLALDRARRRLRLVEDRRFRRLPAWELVIRRALSALRDDPAAAEDLARIAGATARNLDREVYGKGLPRDCAALAAVVLAQARLRIFGPEAMEEALTAAELEALQGSGDPYTAAEVLLARAGLDRLRGRRGDALRALEQAHSLAAAVADPHYRGVALVRKGLLSGEMGNRISAREALSAGLPLLAPGVSPHLAAAGAEALERLGGAV